MKNWLINLYPILLIVSVAVFAIGMPLANEVSKAYAYGLGCAGVVVFILGVLGLALKTRKD